MWEWVTKRTEADALLIEESLDWWWSSGLPDGVVDPRRGKRDVAASAASGGFV